MEDVREVMEAAVEAGSILLENGAEITRVEETVRRICTHYGVESCNAFILTNGIFVSTGDDEEQYYAKVRSIPVGTSRMDRVAAVNQLSREITEGRYTPEEALEALKEVRNMPSKSNFVKMMSAGMASGAFCFLSGGNIIDTLASFLTGFIVYIFVLYVSLPHMSKLVGSIFGGVIATLVGTILYKLGFGSNLDLMVIGALIPLVPGTAFVSAIRDITDENYLAGTVRMMYALMVFFSIAAGVGIMYTILQRLMGGLIL